jgi:DNA-directed RNA polymerase specialized sigma24 family protein
MFGGSSPFPSLDRLDALARDDCDPAPRSRDSHHDMSSVLAEIEARIQELERVRREDVFRYLTRNPGARASEIAAGLGVGQGAVSAHLYRGKGRLFASRAGRWYPVAAADSAASALR